MNWFLINGNILKSNKKCADKDLSYKGAKNICLREDVYHDLLNNTYSLEVLGRIYARDFN